MGAVTRPPAAHGSVGSSSPGRRFVVLPHQDDSANFLEAHTKRSKKTREVGGKPRRLRPFLSIMDSLSSMCLCHHHHREDYHQTQSVVIYPLAAFDYPLNHAKLVEQRRRENKHKLFRPVSEDDDSVSFTNHFPKSRKVSF